MVQRFVPDAVETSPVAQEPPWDIRSRSIAGGVLGGVAALVYGEHLLAGLVGRRLATVMPGGHKLWRLAAHGTAVAGLLAGGNSLWNRATRGLEPGAFSQAGNQTAGR